MMRIPLNNKVNGKDVLSRAGVNGKLILEINGKRSRERKNKLYGCMGLLHDK